MKQSVKRKPSGRTVSVKQTPQGTSGREKQQRPIASLREIVRESLLNVLRDESASAAAKASAGRTLLEYFDDADHHNASNKRGVELSIDDLDSEIARLTKAQ